MRSLFLGFFFFVLCFSTNAGATSKDCGRRFRVALYNHEPLFQVKPVGQVEGLFPDLLNEIQLRLGCTIAQEPMDSPRMFDAFKNWRLDMVVFAWEHEELEKAGAYFPIYEFARRLVVNRNVSQKPKKIQDYFEDRRIRFGSLIGVRYFLSAQEERELQSRGRLVGMPNPGASYKHLLEGRIEAMFTSPAVHSYYLREMPELQEKAIVIPDKSHWVRIGIYFSSRRLNSSEVERIKSVIREMKADGTFRRIVSRHVAAEDMLYYRNL